MFCEIASYPISNVFVLLLVSTEAHILLKETEGLSIDVSLSRANIPAELQNPCQRYGSGGHTQVEINVSLPVILHFRT